MKSIFFLLTLLSGLILQTACGGKEPGKPEYGGKPVPVRVIGIRTESIPAVIEIPGTVQPRQRIALSSQINGFVREMRVRVGDTVQQDQVLAILDARDAESQKAAAQAGIDEAQAGLTEARKAYQAAVDMQSATKASAELANQTYGRYQKLFESRSVSPQEIDEVRMRRDAGAAELASRTSMAAASEARIKQLEARTAQAKAQAGRADVLMGWTQIKAPSSGRIVERSADPGTAIFPGSPLLGIESIANPQVTANIPTSQASALHVGMNARIRNTETMTVLEGRVVEIAPLSDPAAHSLQFKVDLPANASLRNGQFVKVEVPAGTRNAMLAPRQAIRETGQLTGVFVVDGSSKARFRLIKIAPFDQERLEILSGIESGEKIVADIISQITDGIPIEPIQ
jgi:multidrug efflux pump subunit AcrA (membrane-fusion protein)